MNKYLAYFVPSDIDPSGLGFHLERHHWFIQEGAFVKKLKKLCPNVSIHFFVTPLLKGNKKGTNDVGKLEDIHGWLHKLVKSKGYDWNKKVNDLIDTEVQKGKDKSCCQFLIDMNLLIKKTWEIIEERSKNKKGGAIPPMEMYIILKGSINKSGETTWKVPPKPDKENDVFNPPTTKAKKNKRKKMGKKIVPQVILQSFGIN